MNVKKRIAATLVALALCLSVTPALHARAAGVDMSSNAVDGGMSHTIALKSDGTVWAWGSNQQMQLGLSKATAEIRTPQEVTGLGNIVSVAAGYDFSVALRFDGTVYTWGGNTQPRPTAISDLSGIVTIAAGQTDILALDHDGNVWQWSFGGAPAQVPGLSQVAAIDVGGSHFLALTYSGNVYAWGGNWSGQLGVGDTSDREVPQKLELSNIIDISAGHGHSLAVSYDGVVYAWGENTYGQLGNGTTRNSTVPVEVSSITNAVQVSAGNDVSMARTKDGKVYTWGYGEYGQLGTLNASLTQSKPKAISGTTGKAAFIASGVYHNMYVSEDGALYAWGRNRDYQLGNNKNSNAETPQRILDSMVTDETYEIDILGSASSWAVAELDALYAKDLITPILWSDFQNDITRAEFSHILVTLYEKVKDFDVSTRDSTKFKDIKGHFYEDDILKAYNLGLTNGTSATTFSPDSPLTRQEAATLLCTFLSKVNDVTISERVTSMAYYADAGSIADWAVPYVAYAYRENILQGSGDRFNPLDRLSREQALLIVARVVEKYGWG